MKLQQLFEREKFIIYNTKTKQQHTRKSWTTHKGAKTMLQNLNDPDLKIASELFFIDNIQKDN